MKKFAAMCLIASMIASMGSVTGYAAEADGAGQTAVYQTADLLPMRPKCWMYRQQRIHLTGIRRIR